MPTSARRSSSYRSGGFGWSNKQSGSGNPTAYRNCKNQFANKVNSYKTLISQTEGGSAKFGRPTPSTLNTFANWINKGAVIRTISASQIAKWAKNTNYNFTPSTAGTSTCKNVLCKKFGRSAIKAVARTKTGQFMVAFSPATGSRTMFGMK